MYSNTVLHVTKSIIHGEFDTVVGGGGESAQRTNVILVICRGKSRGTANHTTVYDAAWGGGAVAAAARPGL